MKLPLPMTCILSFGVGCYGNHWHVPSRSNLDRAGNCDTAGIGSEIPSCSHYGNRNTQQGGRLQGGYIFKPNKRINQHTVKTEAIKKSWKHPLVIIIFKIRFISKSLQFSLNETSGSKRETTAKI